MPVDFSRYGKQVFPALSFILIFVGLLFSRAVLSVGSIALILSLIPYFREIKKENFHSLFMFIPVIFLAASLLDLFRRDFPNSWGKDVEMNMLWAVMSSLILYFSLALQKDVIQKLKFVLILLVAAVNLISVIHYLQNREVIDQLLLQSKHIPVFGGMHHIYFGILNATLVLLKIADLLHAETAVRTHAWIKKIEGWAIAIILMGMHVLSSRTGLFSFYMVLVILLIYAAYMDKKKRKLVAWIAIPAILLPAISFVALPSFRNKIANTTEDLMATEKGGEEVNFKSVGMRMEAWKVSMGIIQTHPITGVGAGNVEQAMQKQYEESGSVLIPENRIGPHHQFLEFGIKHGVLGILLLGVMFIYLWARGFRDKNLAWLAVTTLFFISFMLESMLERQHGIVIFSITYLWCKSDKNGL